MQVDYQHVSMRFGQSGISYKPDRMLPEGTNVETFSDRLKSRRKECGLSQVELCELVGIKQNQYSRYENGTVPEVELLIKFAVALECTTDYLLLQTEKPNEIREYESLPEDEKRLVQEFRAFKRNDPMARAAIKMLRDLNVIEEPQRASIEPPQEPDVPGEKKTANR
jgi:transcriptional regulator with XRE-family HTH domain